MEKIKFTILRDDDGGRGENEFWEVDAVGPDEVDVEFHTALIIQQGKLEDIGAVVVPSFPPITEYAESLIRRREIPRGTVFVGLVKIDGAVFCGQENFPRGKKFIAWNMKGVRFWTFAPYTQLVCPAWTQGRN